MGGLGAALRQLWRRLGATRMLLFQLERSASRPPTKRAPTRSILRLRSSEWATYLPPLSLRASSG